MAISAGAPEYESHIQLFPLPIFLLTSIHYPFPTPSSHSPFSLFSSIFSPCLLRYVLLPPPPPLLPLLSLLPPPPLLLPPPSRLPAKGAGSGGGNSGRADSHGCTSSVGCVKSPTVILGLLNLVDDRLRQVSA